MIKIKAVGKRVIRLAFLCMMSMALSACSDEPTIIGVIYPEGYEEMKNDSVPGKKTDSEASASDSADSGSVAESSGSTGVSETTDTAKAPVDDVVVYVNSAGERFEMAVDTQVTMHDYDWKKLIHTPDMKKYPDTYEDDAYNLRKGLDVSQDAGKIDWKQVKEAGLEFVFIRLGYRGSDAKGKLQVDKEFRNNLKGAQAEGLDIGVYFSSQAVSEKEAGQEAAFVLRELKKANLALPVVYCPEYYTEEVPTRNKDITKEQCTKNTLAFFKKIEGAGYQTAVFADMYREGQMYDLSQIQPRPIWYSEFNLEPKTPYYLTYWQFTENGQVPGIEERVHMDVEFVKQ